MILFLCVDESSEREKMVGMLGEIRKSHGFPHRIISGFPLSSLVCTIVYETFDCRPRMTSCLPFNHNYRDRLLPSLLNTSDFILIVLSEESYKGITNHKLVYTGVNKNLPFSVPIHTPREAHINVGITGSLLSLHNWLGENYSPIKMCIRRPSPGMRSSQDLLVERDSDSWRPASGGDGSLLVVVSIPHARSLLPGERPGKDKMKIKQSLSHTDIVFKVGETDLLVEEIKRVVLILSTEPWRRIKHFYSFCHLLPLELVNYIVTLFLYH
jgi:hypothetical protein